MRFYTNVAKYKDHILVSGYDENGNKFIKKDEFSPSLYIPDTTMSANTIKALDGTKVVEKNFPTISDAIAYCKSFSGVSNHKIYGMQNWIFNYIAEKYPGDIEYDESLINIMTYDTEMRSDDGFPEASKADKEITAFTVHFSTEPDTFIAMGCGIYDPAKRTKLLDKKVIYIKCEDELDLLRQFMSLMTVRKPDIITGWNTETFDIPYLVNRVSKLFGDGFEKNLSPWNMIRSREKPTIHGKTETVYNLIGIQHLDYLAVFKKFGVALETPENYQLNTVARMVLGEEKVEYSDDYDTLDDFYLNDYQKFIDYALKDTLLVVMLENQLKFISVAITLAYKMGVNYTDSLGTVGVWDSYIHRELKAEGVAIPPTAVDPISADFSGGFVKEPLVGLYKWILSFDFASLYPSIIIQGNLSPEMIVEGTREVLNPDDFLIKGVRNIKHKEYSMAGNGVYFRKDQQGVIPRLVEKTYGERVVAKKTMQSKQRLLERIEDEQKRRNSTNDYT